MIRYLLLIIGAGLLMAGCGLFPWSGGSEPELEFDRSEYEGLEVRQLLTLRDGSADRDPETVDTVAVTVRSESTEPEGEQVVLTETGTSTGIFTGSFGFERPYSNDGFEGVTPGNGLLGVYADGYVGAREKMLAEYDGGNALAEEATATAEAYYEEPPSTVSGVITNQTGAAVSGASVRLYSGNLSFDVTVGSRLDGVYAIYDVPSGSYTLEVDRDSYELEKKTVFVP
jgi:hypothetical protein